MIDTPIPTGRITGISGAPRRPGRFDLAIDGRSATTLSIEAIERLKLAVGAVVDNALAATLAREAALLGTYDRALNLLALRARSSTELRRLLVRKGEAADLVDAAIGKLLGNGFLDDAAFARQFARSRALGAGHSRRRVQQELARRGVARDVADTAIGEVFTEERIDEDGTLERVARKKLATLARLDAPTRRRRLYAFLARRGFDGDDIARTVRKLMCEADPETDAEADVPEETVAE